MPQLMVTFTVLLPPRHPTAATTHTTDQFDASEASHSECCNHFDVFQSNCSELVVVGVVDRRRRKRRVT